MRLLVDTHTLLWWLGDAPLAGSAHALLEDPSNLAFVSAATAWEVAIKQALGKLSAPNDFAATVVNGGFELLPISVAHAITAGRLPPHHRDPFDRMLIAQAQHEGLTIVTRDVKFASYDVPTVIA